MSLHRRNPRRDANEAGWDFRRTYDRSAAMTAVNIQRRTRTVVLQLRRGDDPKHGTTAAYARGCGCNPCRAANMRAQRRKRDRDVYGPVELAILGCDPSL